MHSNGVCHGSLSLETIALTTAGLKLIDVGVATLQESLFIEADSPCTPDELSKASVRNQNFSFTHAIASDLHALASLIEVLAPETLRNRSNVLATKLQEYASGNTSGLLHEVGSTFVPATADERAPEHGEVLQATPGRAFDWRVAATVSGILGLSFCLCYAAFDARNNRNAAVTEQQERTNKPLLQNPASVDVVIPRDEQLAKQADNAKAESKSALEVSLREEALRSAIANDAFDENIPSRMIDLIACYHRMNDQINFHKAGEKLVDWTRKALAANRKRAAGRGAELVIAYAKQCSEAGATNENNHPLNERASELIAEGIDILEKCKGQDHDKVVQAKSIQIDILMRAQHLAEAEPLCNQLIEMLKHTDNKHQSLLPATRLRLALCQGGQGRPALATPVLRENIQLTLSSNETDQEKVLRLSHLLTAVRATGATPLSNCATELMVAALVKRTGKESVLTTKFMCLMQTEISLLDFEKLMASTADTTINSANASDIAECKFTLAQRLADYGQLHQERMRVLIREGSSIIARFHLKHSTAEFQAKGRLAQLDGWIGNLEEAERLYKEMLKVKGETKIDAATESDILSRLADILYRRNKLPEAISSYQDARTLLCRSHNNDGELAHIDMSMAVLFRKCGNAGQSNHYQALAQAEYRRQIKVYGAKEQWELQRRTIYDFATQLRAVGLNEQAMVQWQDLLKVRLNESSLWDLQNEFVAHKDMGTLLKEKKEYKSALSQHQAALAVYKRFEHKIETEPHPGIDKGWYLNEKSECEALKPLIQADTTGNE